MFKIKHSELLIFTSISLMSFVSEANKNDCSDVTKSGVLSF